MNLFNGKIYYNHSKTKGLVLLICLFTLIHCNFFAEKQKSSGPSVESIMQRMQETITTSASVDLFSCCPHLPATVINELEPQIDYKASTLLQSYCDSGTILWNSKNDTTALYYLEKSESLFITLPTRINADSFYYAKALYHIGEIYHHLLVNSFKKDKNNDTTKYNVLLKNALKAYSTVAHCTTIPWSIKSRFQSGQLYEDFAVGILQRHSETLSGDPVKALAQQLSLCSYIEDLLTVKAAANYRENINICKKSKSDDYFCDQSTYKIPFLYLTSAHTYLCSYYYYLQTIKSHPVRQDPENFSPFETNAIRLFIKVIENSPPTLLEQQYRARAESTILSITLKRAAYSDSCLLSLLANYHLNSGNDSIYKKAIYYCNKAADKLISLVGMRELFNLHQDTLSAIKNQISRLLYTDALLCKLEPYYPTDSLIQKFKIIYNLALQGIASGEYVKHAYIFLYQHNPLQYGIYAPEFIQTAITSGTQWKTSLTTDPNWYCREYNDSGWNKALQLLELRKNIDGFPFITPTPMWHTQKDYNKNEILNFSQKVSFRRSFKLQEIPQALDLYLSYIGKITVFLNEKEICNDTAANFSPEVNKYDLKSASIPGSNIIAFQVQDSLGTSWGIYPMIIITTKVFTLVPQIPQLGLFLKNEDVKQGIYNFPMLEDIYYKNKI
jgi:hypothetical protein